MKETTSTKGNGTERASATAAEARRVPTVLQLAAFVGVTLGKALPKHIVQMFLRPLPAMASLLDDTSKQLAIDAEILQINDIKPEDLLAMKAEHRDLSAREAVTGDVARRAAEQRMQADDTMLKTLFRIHKRVKERAEDHPDLLVDWKFLLDFVRSYRPGRGPSTATAPSAAPTLQSAPSPAGGSAVAAVEPALASGSGRSSRSRRRR